MKKIVAAMALSVVVLVVWWVNPSDKEIAEHLEYQDGLVTDKSLDMMRIDTVWSSNWITLFDFTSSTLAVDTIDDSTFVLYGITIRKVIIP